MQIEKTISVKPHEAQMLIASIRHSIKACDEKFKKFGRVVLLSDLDDREQENYV